MLPLQLLDTSSTQHLLSILVIAVSLSRIKTANTKLLDIKLRTQVIGRLSLPLDHVYILAPWQPKQKIGPVLVEISLSRNREKSKIRPNTHWREAPENFGALSAPPHPLAAEGRLTLNT